MRFKNKVVIITGSGRGIGRATALLFAKEGAKVVVVADVNDKEGEETVTSIKNAKEDAFYVKCDVSKEEQVKQMIEKTIKTFGKIDILVNNAGIVFDVPFAERTVEQWRRTLDVNLIGTFLCAKYVAPHMKKQNGGKIVNISSTNGIDSFNPASMDYDASKAGIIILTRDLAKELAPTIQVNSVAPGWVNTDMNKDLPEDFVEEESKKIYAKRFATPEEIAKAVLFLASDDASYITGVTLKVDGGYG
ncbi:MAG: glucose 1-dehydrogenase [Nanoarchaeota archaeon]|nr:glucose 1-dehydrogenase [Nanoarchaeota archaeon]MBU4300876.1 glucose 1-dehydrogenase [Nanoarchaeota archaeon]MBU4451418.1 glucose 1-dehydrogenase [Nanoarchaeota archaeon]MCG2724508.1 glucose 1-dehydrogenase [archaeon]